MSVNSEKYHLFGIRHHGPGSAASLLESLEALQPDAVLIEGPPDAEAVLPLANHSEMKPPLALLIYAVDDPRQASFYPFAMFSPEWQAMRFALQNEIPVQFMDLPQTHQMGLIRELEESAEEDNEDIEDLEFYARSDPLSYLAQAAGYEDGERWWEHIVEQRSDSHDIFQGIQEAMTALRAELPPQKSGYPARREALRESWMRKTLRKAIKDGFERIAVVCGAWHVPALATLPPMKEDNALLKNLSKVKVQATWTPWTHSRLAYDSGYGAGIESPGWYEHLWQVRQQAPEQHARQVAIGWLSKAARLLRGQGLDASSASVIEAVRLVETLAALRDRPLPGLAEMNEATQTVLCFGDTAPMQLIKRELTVGERLGEVSADTPSIPLQHDLQQQQKRLRLKAEAVEKEITLDLRKPVGLERSQLLHCLNMLNIPWGELSDAGNSKGTFKEVWRLQWQPEFVIQLIEASIWGTTVKSAASAHTMEQLQKAGTLNVLTTLLDQALLADLPEAVHHAMHPLESESAVSSDISQLMASLPPLANVQRYGNVRQTDVELVSTVVSSIITRVCIGLPGACASLNEDVAREMYKHLVETESAIHLLQSETYLKQWRETLLKLADQDGLNGLIAGRACRLLLEAGALDTAEVADRMRLALSRANDAAQAGAWVEGLLQGSGLILLHDDKLLSVLDDWLTGLTEDLFIEVLPLVRRTFAGFSPPERQQLGERIRRGQVQIQETQITAFDTESADAVLPLLSKLLGLTAESRH
ncbi:MAG: DUF5682 family protein [Pseudomonadota bacterium]